MTLGRCPLSIFFSRGTPPREVAAWGASSHTVDLKGISRIAFTLLIHTVGNAVGKWGAPPSRMCLVERDLHHYQHGRYVCSPTEARERLDQHHHHRHVCTPHRDCNRHLRIVEVRQRCEAYSGHAHAMKAGDLSNERGRDTRRVTMSRGS